MADAGALSDDVDEDGTQAGAYGHTVRWWWSDGRISPRSVCVRIQGLWGRSDHTYPSLSHTGHVRLDLYHKSDIPPGEMAQMESNHGRKVWTVHRSSQNKLQSSHAVCRTKAQSGLHLFPWPSALPGLSALLGSLFQIYCFSEQKFLPSCGPKSHSQGQSSDMEPHIRFSGGWVFVL